MEKYEKEISAIKINQWLNEWNDVIFDSDEHRRRPEPSFYLFSISAKVLRKLSTVYVRKAEGPRALDMSIQRAHEMERSEEISRYIHGGFPWSSLNMSDKDISRFFDLRMPGWLPTAIIVNFLAPGSKRNDVTIEDKHVIKIQNETFTSAKIILPDGYDKDDWAPLIPPIEIIDGQHRLFAFNESKELDGLFELPVVAFNNLDFTWQAYLFYTINIRPKKINTSLAYDLYPLLRIQDWLEKSPDGPMIYRETRAQELTEAMWSHPESPWKDRINMVGGPKKGDVTQASFIRSLTASFIRRGSKIGGLFGAELHKGKNDVLPWGRIRQAAFLIVLWKELKKAVFQNKDEWAKELRSSAKEPQLQFSVDTNDTDLAFSGPHSLLSTDQGVRGISQIFNDLCFIASDDLKLDEWNISGLIEDDLDFDQISIAIQSIEKYPVYDFIQKVCKDLAKFDWRTSSTPNLSNEKRRAQMVFKGSSGYKEIRDQLKSFLCDSKDEFIKNVALKI